jgi:hypothetical protein
MGEMVIRRIFKAAVAAGVALGVTAAVAAGGQYHVYSCRTPSGGVAPVDGWGGSVAGAYTVAENTCPQGGALIAALTDQPARTANADIATWAFAAPAGASIAGALLWRAGDADGGGAVNASYGFWLAGPNNTNDPYDAFVLCVGGSECPTGLGTSNNPMAPENRVSAPSANLSSHLFLDASCGGEPPYKCPIGSSDANGYTAVGYLYAADLTLEQAAGPHATSVTGELASAPTVRGLSDVAFDATDPGAGVYEALFTVDGRVVQRTVLDDNGGRCRDVGQTTDGLAAFLYVQPCLPSVSADVPFDTTSASNGAHHLLVSVIDAAGNAAPVLDRTLTIANPPSPGAPGPANGANASAQATLTARWHGTKRASLTTDYGRARVLMGRLTAPGGAPISGASLDLRAGPSYAGARPVAMAGPRTDANGRFVVRIPAGSSSRTLRLAYRAHLGDALPVATRTLRLNVRAGIVLRVSPHSSSVGHTIQFRGRLHGTPIPRGGKQLVLEARSPGSAWIEFKVIRTDRHGRYAASYRFKFPGPAAYRFRVRSEAESDFPFAAGSSNVVGVHER